MVTMGYYNIRVGSLEHFHELWLLLRDSSNQFHFNIPSFFAFLNAIFVRLEGSLDVDEIASVPVNAEEVIFKTAALFRLVFRVMLVVFPQLSQSMSKFATLLIRAVTIFHEFLAKLWLFLVCLFSKGSFLLILSGIRVALFLEPGLTSVQEAVDIVLSSHHDLYL